MKKQLEELVNNKHSENNSLYMNPLKEEIEYVREQNRAKKLIIKQLTDTKTTTNPTSTSVSSGDTVLDTITQHKKEKQKKNINKNLQM